MSTSTQSKGKKAKLSTASASASDAPRREPVAGPSSERLDHAQNADLNDEDDEEAMDGDSEEPDGSDEDGEDLSGISEGSVSGDEDEEDDYEDILAANENAGKKSEQISVCRLHVAYQILTTVCLSERKRALPTHAFGSMLSSLIAAPVPTKPLRPLHPPASAEALERRARAALTAQKYEREERGHVKDVIAGWTPRPNVPFSQWNTIDTTDPNSQVEYAIGGAEKEKELRRLAQRGVVRLFNAIKAAQYTEETVTKSGGVAAIANTEEETSSSSRQAIKDASPAPPAGIAGMQPVTRAPNVLGSRGRQEAREYIRISPYSRVPS